MSAKEPWWKIHLFRGMMHDIRRRAPYYISDFTDAWDYRVVPSTGLYLSITCRYNMLIIFLWAVYMYFAK
jgi:hypothetical protein